MKDFAGSSITYYGLAREKLMNRYPRLISVLVILALICMTGLALFLISDLISFVSNPDHGSAMVGLDLNGPENGIKSITGSKEKSGNISENSSLTLENVSLQTKEQSFANQSKMNASLPSSQAAKGVVATSNSSSGKSPVIKHHSSSSSSSSSSSAKTAKKSTGENNQTDEMTKSPTPANQSMNATKSAIADGNNLSNEGQSSVLSDQEGTNPQGSNDTMVAPTRIISFVPSVASGAIINQAKDTPARESVSTIKFKTKETISPKSDLRSEDTTATPNSQSIVTTSASSQKSKATVTSQAKKVQEARAKLKANRDRIVENMKNKATQSRAKAAPNQP